MIRLHIAYVGLLAAMLLSGCGGGSSSSTPVPVTPTPVTPTPPDVFASYKLTGDVSPVHDPSIIMQGSTYYSFTTDAAAGDGLPIRCSTDKLAWTACGHIFNAMPAWIAAKVPLATDLWAPDVSFFNGIYHVYYAASSFGSQQSAIGLVTNTTLDSTSAAYKWVDQGEVVGSSIGDSFNAIDPNILVDATGNIWLSYGSFWNGIFQRQVDPTTGMLLASNATVYPLAQRPAVTNDPIEGSSQIHHGNYYYLFVSLDYCCQSSAAGSNYKIAVGRSTSPNGPFVDQNGTAMLQGGATVLLQGNGTSWSAPGGQTVYLDPATGNDIIVFHALNLGQNGLDQLWVNALTWTNDWPTIQPD